jgi:hypothetical protein
MTMCIANTMIYPFSNVNPGYYLGALHCKLTLNWNLYEENRFYQRGLLVCFFNLISDI